VIIAGGQGERLGGVRKADLRIGGTRQIDRVVAALDGVALPIVVAGGPHGQFIAMPPGCLAVADLESACAGPLAGLAAAVAQLAESGVTAGHLISVAVDTPFLPDDFVARLLAGMGDTAAAYAAWGEDFYPPNAAWRIEALQSLPSDIAGGKPPASLKALQRALGAQRVDWASGGAGNPFANINTLADLLALQRAAPV
jgi:molybdopterin-guanine dinucleotide biosynthesis protein A